MNTSWGHCDRASGDASAAKRMRWLPLPAVGVSCCEPASRVPRHLHICPRPGGVLPSFLARFSPLWLHRAGFVTASDIPWGHPCRPRPSTRRSSRRLLHAGHARRVQRRGCGAALRGGGGGARHRRGTRRGDPEEAAEAIRRGARPRQSTSPNSRPRPISSAIPSSAWCDLLASQVGGAATMCIGARRPRTSWTRPLCSRCARPWRWSRTTGGHQVGARRPCRQTPRHGDGGPHPSPARAACDLRLQGRRLARHGAPPPPAPRRAAPVSWSASSPAPPARSPRWETRASPCTMR